MDEIKLVCFDLDQTLINKNSWRELSLALGISALEDARLFAEFKAGKITYEIWNDIVLEEYLKHQDASREGITKILSNYTLNPGAREAVNYIREKDYELVLISGGIDIIVNMVAKDLGISFAKANNTFRFDENDRLMAIHTTGDNTHEKANHLESFCELLNIKMTECACVADGDNDLEMFKRTKHGITFVGSPIEADAWKIIDSLEDIPLVL